MDKIANPQMIVLGRELRGFSQAELADQIDVTQGYLSRLEQGLVESSEDIIERIAKALNFTFGFFTRRTNIVAPNLYYRKKSKTSKKTLIKAEAEMNLHRLNAQSLLKSIEVEYSPLPSLDIDQFNSPERVAQYLRQLWAIPKGPIHRLFETIEKKGVIIIHCHFDTPEIDGRSMFTDSKQPLIFLNDSLPMDRQRFTVVHELAHLIMHMHSSYDDNRDIEKEANKFAAEFLIPTEELRKQVFGPLNIAALADLKRYWRSSMASILYHCNSSKIISAHRYKSLVIEMGRLGMRTSEPSELEPPKETPMIFSTLFTLHQRDLGYTTYELAQILNMNEDEMKLRYLPEEKPKLRLMI